MGKSIHCRDGCVVSRWLTALYCCFALVTMSPAWAQVKIPDTPAGRTLNAMLDAFNSGDRGRMSAFYTKYYPGVSIENAMSFRNQTGGFDLLEIRKSEPLRVEYLVKERASETKALAKLNVSDTDPPIVTGFLMRALPPGVTTGSFVIDAATRDRVIDGAVAKLNEFYVFPDTAKKMEDAIRERQKRGEYDAVTDGDIFANLLTQHLQGVSHDKHLRINFSPAPIPPPSGPTPQAMEQMRKQMERNNCGFVKVEQLPNNIGYVKFNMFANTQICAPTVIAAMNFVENADALIFDLRDNGGGDPQMVTFISSYLFAKPTHLNDLWERKTDTTREFWTSEEVSGKKLDSQPVYVLTSSRTFSGAEEFTYNLKNQKRATIVGETTGGGAHPVRGVPIDERFVIGVPFARAINPITKTNWEGTGVEPDVKVTAADALSKAQQLALEKIRERK